MRRCHERFNRVVSLGTIGPGTHWRHYALALVLSISVLVLIASQAAAQTRLVVRDGAIPRRLRVDISHWVTLRERGEAQSWIFPSTIVRDRNGFFYVLDQTGPNSIQVFDSTGRTVRHIPRDQALIDRRVVREIAITPPDTLHVLSGGDAVFDAAGRRVRADTLPENMMIWNALGLPDGRLVVRALFRTPDLFGYPLHLLGMRGAVEKSFGAGKSDPFDGSVPKISGTLALGTDGTFWSSAMSRYQVALWSSAGRLIRLIDRQTAWFQAWDTWDGRMDVESPVPRLVAIWQDRQGRLLTLSHVAAERWKPIPGRRAGHEAPSVTVREFDDANDSMMEVIDPALGVVLATARFSQTLTRFVDDSMVAGVSQQPVGAVVVDIWKFRLVPQTGGKR